MAFSPEEHSKIKNLLTEAIILLCKNRVNCDKKFKIEGLIGITVDERDVSLININQDVAKENFEDPCEVYQLAPLDNNEQDKDNGSDTNKHLEGIDSTLHIGNGSRVNYNSLNPASDSRPKRKRKPSRVILEQANNSKSESDDSNVKDTDGEKKGSFFSPTVDQIIQQYEQQQYTSSSSLVDMAKRKRRKYPTNITELHTQGLLPILSRRPESQLVPLMNKPQENSTRVIIRRSSGANTPTVIIKPEPIDDGYEITPINTSNMLTIEPLSHSPINRCPSILRRAGSNHPNAEVSTQWVQECILKSEGCFVSTRVILRRYAALRGESVVQAMNGMTYDRDSDRYIGEFKHFGRVQVFYKCPPILLKPVALDPYKLSLDEYSHIFFANPKPSNGTPNQWFTYANKVLEGVPYNPHLFPIEALEMEGRELDVIIAKRHQMEAQYGEGDSGGLVLGSWTQVAETDDLGDQVADDLQDQVADDLQDQVADDLQDQVAEADDDQHLDIEDEGHLHIKTEDT